MNRGQAIEILKEDALGRVECVAIEGRPACVRRVACGGRIPGSGIVARILLARERRALRSLASVAGVPRLVDDASLAGVPNPTRGMPRAREVLLRSWIEGAPLHRTESLPEDFFDHLDALVARLHECGVCHNDLHKEQNILVDPAGYPWLVDFQLASCHTPGTRVWSTRAREDLRHVEKHRRRYARRDAVIPREALPRGRGHAYRRSFLAWVWRRGGKPVYEFVTRRLLRTRDGEARRATSGPWPEWTAPLGPIHPASRDVT